jgi:hypothetical protein
MNIRGALCTTDRARVGGTEPCYRDKHSATFRFTTPPAAGVAKSRREATFYQNIDRILEIVKSV